MVIVGVGGEPIPEILLSGTEIQMDPTDDDEDEDDTDLERPTQPEPETDEASPQV